jgi:hypothetical protein
LNRIWLTISPTAQHPELPVLFMEFNKKETGLQLTQRVVEELKMKGVDCNVSHVELLSGPALQRVRWGYVVESGIELVKSGRVTYDFVDYDLAQLDTKDPVRVYYGDFPYTWKYVDVLVPKVDAKVHHLYEELAHRGFVRDVNSVRFYNLWEDNSGNTSCFINHIYPNIKTTLLKDRRMCFQTMDVWNKREGEAEIVLCHRDRQRKEFWGVPAVVNVIPREKFADTKKRLLQVLKIKDKVTTYEFIHDGSKFTHVMDDDDELYGLATSHLDKLILIHPNQVAGHRDKSIKITDS